MTVPEIPDAVIALTADELRAEWEELTRRVAEYANALRVCEADFAFLQGATQGDPFLSRTAIKARERCRAVLAEHDRETP